MVAADSEPLEDPAFQQAYVQARSLASAIQDDPDFVVPWDLKTRAVANHWHSILFHLHLAEAIRTREKGGYNRDAIEAFLAEAEKLGDFGLIAKGMASQVLLDDPSYVRDSGDQLLARAVALLETGQGSVLHRPSAYIQCGVIYGRRQLWPLLGEMNRRAFDELGAELPDAFDEMARRAKIATIINRVMVHAAVACEAYEAGAPDDAVEELRRAPEVTPDLDGMFTIKRRLQLAAARDLMEALVGNDPGPERPTVETLIENGLWRRTIGYGFLANAIRLLRDGDDAQAADIADEAVEYLSEMKDPVYTLALCVAARRPPVSAAAVRYGRELATDRRAKRMQSVADAITRLAAEEILLAGRELKNQACTDPLTGATNRRGLDEFRSMSLNNPNRPDLGVIALDVDRFKSVNDGHGHEIGDQVLVKVAAEIQNSIRPSDLAIRPGGDEFIVILVGVTADVTRSRAKALGQRISDIDWGTIQPGLTVSASIGCATGASESIDTLLTEADKRMYKDKERNVMSRRPATIRRTPAGRVAVDHNRSGNGVPES